MPLAELAAQLSKMSALEMADALGGRRAPPWLRNILAVPFAAASRPLGRMLAELDHDSELYGLPYAAARALERLRAGLTTSGACPARGALLVLANHPGAYDALALMSALARRDLAIVAADRTFLRALPRVARHLVFVPDRHEGRAAALRRALSHLGAGGALLHFPAGGIEPDPDFADEDVSALRAWTGSVAPLVRAAARAGGNVVVAGVRGVHSPFVKRSWIARVAERRGITTLAPLVQVLARARDVSCRVAISESFRATELLALGSDEALQSELRSALARAVGVERRGASAVAIAEPAPA
jgi:1-acyl-sn-glycerol-3-phosphate acyltransferase